MKISEVLSTIEKIAPPHLAASWDNCGMQVASFKEDIRCIALCLDPTPLAIERAMRGNAELIISHHPLLMQGRLPHKLDAFHEVLRKLFLNDVALYAAHTSLDVNISGPCGWLARTLRLQNISTLDSVGSFENMDGVEQECGYGIVGDLSSPMAFDALLALLQKNIDLSTATRCGGHRDIELHDITRVAYCPGSGASLMHKAHAKGAQIFITGDVKHHFALESPLCMFDVGHHSLEEKMMYHFMELLAKLLPTVHMMFIPSASPLQPLCKTQ